MRLKSFLLFSSIGLGCSTAASQGDTIANSSATATATDGTTGEPNGTTSPGGSTGTTDSPTTGLMTTDGPGTTTAASDTAVMPETTSGGMTTEATTIEGATDTASTGETTTTGEFDTTSSDSSTTGGTTGPIGGGPCETDEDCKLHDDCCSCYGIPVDQSDPICKAECDQTQCEQIGIDKAVCVLGQCTTEKVDCSSEVACDSLPPECPPGTLPGVDGACWSGACVPAVSCDKVPDCKACPEQLLCVKNQAFTSEHTCLPMPEECGGEASCACAGEACVQPFGLCIEGVGDVDLSCECPNC